MENTDKVNIIHFGLSGNPGGIETYLLKIASRIDRTRFSFSFIDTTASNSLPCFHDEFSGLGCHFYTICPRRKSVLKNKKDLNNLFKNNNFNVLHFHVNTLSYIEPVLIALKYGVKVVIHSRNAGTQGSFITNALHFFNKKKVEALGQKVTRVAVSELAGKWLFGDKQKFTILNNGVNTKKFYFDKNSRDKVRKALKISEDTIALGSIAAFTPAKNQQFILDVLFNMNKSDFKFKVFFVGDGHLKAGIEALAKKYSLENCVEFLGKKSNIPELMSAFDILLLPSFYEGFPNVVLEAQSCGLPCIISNCITEEVVVDKSLVCRLPINDDSRQEWAVEIDNVAKMILNSDAELRETAFKTIDQRGFSTKNEIEKLENLYSSVVG